MVCQISRIGENWVSLLLVIGRLGVYQAVAMFIDTLGVGGG